MDISQFCNLLMPPARVKALGDILKNKKIRHAGLNGLVGSAPAVVFSRLPMADAPYIAVANDLDEAGYLYNDLCQILGDDAVLMFPSGYKRDIRYGQEDPPSQILRAEVLSRWGSGVRIVVSYPEALAEKVAPRERLQENTLCFRKGGTADLTVTASKLRENGFTEVDYVYEPGQFAVRGSILDIFSYSNEFPYRLDFFGDDIESIRTFNIETQLSERQVDEIAVVNNLKPSEGGMSLLDFAGDSSVVLLHDPEWLRQRIRAVASETISESALIAKEGDSHAMRNVVDADAFCATLERMRTVDYGIADRDGYDARLSFDTSLQGVFHKNFDIISESLGAFADDGYKIYVLSDSEPQFERLRVIFEDRGDKISFIPVLRTLHEGFIDNSLKICAFTDHQIFERFHRYTLKSDRVRSGKLALSLKELSQIEVGDYIVHVDHGVGKFGGLVHGCQRKNAGDD